jgi:hypothetical protein
MIKTGYVYYPGLKKHGFEVIDTETQTGVELSFSRTHEAARLEAIATLRRLTDELERQGQEG